MLDLMTLYTTQRKQYVCWSGHNNHWVSSQQESGSEMKNLALSRNMLPRTYMTADGRDDKDIKKNIQEAKCSGQYAGQEIFICTY